MPRKLDDEDRMIRRIEEGDRRRDNPRESPRERQTVTWRDRDRKKDRSSSSSSEPRDKSQWNDGGPGGRFKADQQRKSHLAAAEALFANPGRDGLDKKVLEATSADIEMCVDEYLQKFGYPNSAELLERFLEHPSTDIFKETVGRLEALFPELPQTRQDQLLQALEALALGRRDPAARRAANNLVRKVKKS